MTLSIPPVIEHPYINFLDCTGISDDTIVRSTHREQASVFAGSPTGGYALISKPNTNMQTNQSVINQIRLETAILCDNAVHCDAYIGPYLDLPPLSLDQVATRARSERVSPKAGKNRTGAVRQVIEINDFEADLHNHAVEARRLLIRTEGETEVQRAEKDAMSHRWEASWKDARERVVTHIKNMRKVNLNGGETSIHKLKKPSRNYDVTAEIEAKLALLEEKLSGDPDCVNGHYLYHAQIPPLRDYYAQLDEAARLEFWAEQWPRFKHLWYWDFVGLFDVIRTFEDHHMNTWNLHQFAYQAHSLFANVISWSCFVENNRRNPNVKQRTLKLPDGVLGKYETKRRDTCHVYNALYNAASEEEPNCGHYGLEYVVEDLSRVKVHPGSRDKKGGITSKERTHIQNCERRSRETDARGL